MKLLDFYASVLQAVGMSVDREGYVNCELFEVSTPAMIDGHRLVLPTREHLNNQGLSDNFIFHPMRENSFKGASPVLEYYRKAAMVQLETYFHTLAIRLLRLCASTDDHKTLSPDQSEVLSAIKKVDADTVERYQELTSKIGDEPNLNLIRIFLKKGAKLGSKTYKQGAIVTFPLYEELKRLESVTAKERQLGGISLRVMDVKAFLAIIEYVLPQVAQENAYSKGSDAILAPRFEALIGAVYNLGACLNDKIVLMQDKLQGITPLAAEWSDYMDQTDDFTNEVRGIPMQRGNEGKDDKLAQLQQSTAEVSQRLADDRNVQIASTPAMSAEPARYQSEPLESDKTPTRKSEVKRVPLSEAFSPSHMQQPTPQQYAPQQGLGIPAMQHQPHQQQIPPGYMVNPQGQLVPMVMTPPVVPMGGLPTLGGMPMPVEQGHAVTLGAPPMQQQPMYPVGLQPVQSQYPQGGYPQYPQMQQPGYPMGQPMMPAPVGFNHNQPFGYYR